MESDPPDGNFVVKKGKHIELRCRASGNPPPDIHWTKEVEIEREQRARKFGVHQCQVLDRTLLGFDTLLTVT